MFSTWDLNSKQRDKVTNHNRVRLKVVSSQTHKSLRNKLSKLLRVLKKRGLICLIALEAGKSKIRQVASSGEGLKS